MDIGRLLGGGVAAGIVIGIADFVLHGLVMGSTYAKYPEVFSQTQANPGLFVLVAVCIGLAAAYLFARTRASWAAGAKGGLAFGACIGLLGWFPNFYAPLVYEGFPYHLAWCWGGIGMIDSLLAGAVLGTIIKRA